MLLLNSEKSLVLMQSGNSFHCLAAKYVKELRPKLVVLGLQRDVVLGLPVLIGDTILIDYQTVSQPEFILLISLFSISCRLLFAWLTPMVL